jgi:hypothetical protein
MEANEIVYGLSRRHASLLTAMIGRNAHIRRLAQKSIFYMMPCRPVIMWLYLIVIRRAFLDGSAGLTYANLRAAYEYLIVLKVRELRHMRDAAG